MSKEINDDIKRWTTKGKAALVMNIIRGKTSVSEARRSYGPLPTGI